jgi:hypothetical protein
VPTLSHIAAVLAAMALCAPGVALLLLGVGLRLRTADAALY